MPAILQPTIADSFPLNCETVSGYTEFFDRLLTIVRGQTITSTLGEQIRRYVLEWLESHTLEPFDRYNDASYRRDYIGRCSDTRWEAIVMSWKQGNTTSIHAHPQFAGYHFADGVFRIEVFKPIESGRAQLIDTLTVDQPTGLFSVGQPGDFDNHIHRITCLSGTGHSLHVYSDDALRGLTYQQIQ